MSSRARPVLLVGVADQAPVDHVGQPPLKAAQGFFVALPVGSFAHVVGAARAVALELGDGHGVQAAVELAVPGAGESVAHDVSGGHLDGGGAGVGGERGGGAEAVHVPDPGEDLPGVEVTDSAQLGQGAAAGLDGVGDLGVRDADAPVEVADLARVAASGMRVSPRQLREQAGRRPTARSAGANPVVSTSLCGRANRSLTNG